MLKSRSTYAAAFAVATLLACTAALPQREQVVDKLLSKISADHSVDSRYYSGNGQKVRNLDSLGGGNLAREVRQARRLDYGLPYISGRRFDSQSPLAEKQENRDLGSAYHYYPKRNFDEIDRTGFDGFARKRNFDEIDRTGFETFVKRTPSEEDVYSLPLYGLRIYDREH